MDLDVDGIKRSLREFVERRGEACRTTGDPRFGSNPLPAGPLPSYPAEDAVDGLLFLRDRRPHERPHPRPGARGVPAHQSAERAADGATDGGVLGTTQGAFEA